MSRGLTLKDVGDFMGVSPQAVAQWERSNPRFDYQKLDKLAEVLEVEVDWLRQSNEFDSIPEPYDYSKHLNRVPILTLPKLMVYFTLFKHGRDGIPEQHSLEPSEHVSKLSFAIIVEEEDAFAILKPGNIAIFDSEPVPTENDIVVAVGLEKGGYTPFFEYYRNVAHKVIAAESLVATRRGASSTTQGLDSMFEGVMVFGVLVENREFPRT